MPNPSVIDPGRKTRRSKESAAERHAQRLVQAGDRLGLRAALAARDREQVSIYQRGERRAARKKGSK